MKARAWCLRACLVLLVVGLGAGTRSVLAEDEPVFDRLDLRDLPLSDVCRVLSDETGMNLVPSAQAGQERVTLFLRGVTVRVAIEVLCRSHGLWFQEDAEANVIRIGTPQEYRRDLVSLSREQTEYFTMLYPNAVDIGYAIQNLFGDRVLLNFGFEEEDLIEDLENRFDRFDVVDERTQGFGTRLTGSSGTTVTPFGASTGSAFGSNGINGFGNTGRVTRRQNRDERGAEQGGFASTQQARERIESLEVDAEEISEMERILNGEGVDEAARERILDRLAQRAQVPIRVTVLRRQNRIAVRTSDESAMDSIRTMVRRLDVPTPMVLLEVRVLSVELGDGASSFFEYQFNRGNGAGAFTGGSIANPTPPGLDLGGTGLRTGDFTFQFVNDQFAARIQALESDNKVRAIASPLLLTANNEVSRLFIGREVPLNRSFVAGQSVTNGTTTTVVPGSTGIEFRPVGTTLLITPTINSDHTVTLRIVQESSNADTTSQILVPNGTGFAQQQVNVVSSQTVSGTIVAKNRLAVAFGGLIEDRKVREQAQVPLLGDVPVLGVMFRRTEVSNLRREVVIMVRPHILSTPAESEGISHRLFERLGIDTRDAGTRPHVRGAPSPQERRAQTRRFGFKFHGMREGGR